MQALLYEVSATPKPGLVDRNNTGAHKDMDIFTFEASAVSLNHYFEKIRPLRHGKRTRKRPRTIFPYLCKTALFRDPGRRCHDDRHQRHQYTQRTYLLPGDLKLLLRLYVCKHIPYSPDTLLSINRKLVADVLEDFKDITAETARTNGETPLRPLWYERSPG